MIKGADAIINTAIPTDEAKLADLNKALGVKATDDKTLGLRPDPADAVLPYAGRHLGYVPGQAGADR